MTQFHIVFNVTLPVTVGHSWSLLRVLRLIAHLKMAIFGLCGVKHPSRCTIIQVRFTPDTRAVSYITVKA